MCLALRAVPISSFFLFFFIEWSGSADKLISSKMWLCERNGVMFFSSSKYNIAKVYSSGCSAAQDMKSMHAYVTNVKREI